MTPSPEATDSPRPAQHAILLVDDSRRIILAEGPTERLVGVPANSLRGRDLAEVAGVAVIAVDAAAAGPGRSIVDGPFLTAAARPPHSGESRARWVVTLSPGEHAAPSRALPDGIPDWVSMTAIAVIATDGRDVVHLNARAAALLGWEPDPAHLTLSEVLDLPTEVGLAVASGEPTSVRVRRASGDTFDAELVVLEIVPQGLRLLLVWDITARMATQRQLAHLATHDLLTGLVNRLIAHDQLDRAIGRLRRYSIPFGLLYVDLDDFKQINDRHGHAAGDAVLVEVARRLRETMRPTDTVARIGGDEFLLLAETVSGAADLATLAGRVRETLAQPHRIGATTVQSGASVGTVLVDSADRAADELLRLADSAMYEEKRAR